MHIDKIKKQRLVFTSESLISDKSSTDPEYVATIIEKFSNQFKDLSDIDAEKLKQIGSGGESIVFQLNLFNEEDLVAKVPRDFKYNIDTMKLNCV